MALSVKPYFFPARWMTTAGLAPVTAGDRSRLGEESLEDGLEDSEWGDMGLASGDAPWWSADRRFAVSSWFYTNKSDWGGGGADLQGSSATAPWPTPT